MVGGGRGGARWPTWAVAAATATVMVALGANAEKSPYFQQSKFEKVVHVWKNGGNNTAEQKDPLLVDINTVTDDFEYFKARVGLKLNYIPKDCTTWSIFRPRLPYRVHTLPPSRDSEPDPRCGYSTYTNHIRVFNQRGEQLHNLYEVEETDSLYVVPPGDLFVWPGQYIGHKQAVPGLLLNGEPVELVTISLEPRGFWIPKFITDDEITVLLDKAGPLLEDSKGMVDGAGVKIAARNSQQAWIGCTPESSSSNLELICSLNDRAAALTNLPSEHVKIAGEAFQVVHYGPQEHYYAHYDWFDPTLHPGTPGLREGYNRMLTLLLYLNDVEEGGHTIFPRAGPDGYGTSNIENYEKCDRGLKVSPKKGAAILWYSLLPQGNGHEGFPDFMSLHGGCDVIKGEKWVANIWVHNKLWGKSKTTVTAEDIPSVDESGSRKQYEAFVASRMGPVTPVAELYKDEERPLGNSVDGLRRQLERVEGLRKELSDAIAQLEGSSGSASGKQGARSEL